MLVGFYRDETPLTSDKTPLLSYHNVHQTLDETPIKTGLILQATLVFCSKIIVEMS
jgi:hypothetical protein